MSLGPPPRTFSSSDSISPIDSNPRSESQYGAAQDMSSIHDLYSAAYPLALQAVQADTGGDHNLAAQRYSEVYKVDLSVVFKVKRVSKYMMREHY
jgi:hypothetical protein